MDETKRVLMQGAFGPLGDRPRCGSCGSYVATYYVRSDSAEFEMGEEFTYDRLCTPCMLRSIAFKPPAAEHAKKAKKYRLMHCRWCWKKRKLVGAWCRNCRNNHQRKKIKEVLEKISKREVLTMEDEWLLAAAPHWTIWHKEFRKVVLP